MSELPATYDVSAGFIGATSADAWEHLRDLATWPSVFPGWLVSIEVDDDRFHAVGAARERYDFYPRFESEQRSIDVEVVDELGSADTLKLRILDIPGGALVIVAHGRLAGTSDADWERKRMGIAKGLAAL